LFDGFDEIDDQCQEKAIQLLMKVINEEKSIQLYVTTRTHTLDKLQLEFSQLANSLENFTEKDQIDYLIKFWKNELNFEEKYNESLGQFAASLIERVSNERSRKIFYRNPVAMSNSCRVLSVKFQGINRNTNIYRTQYFSITCRSEIRFNKFV
jgi:hypothetical protein